jgi:teichuronic acid biosynthesis glycosyltransferase TuaH
MTATDPVHMVVCSLEPWDGVWRRNQYLVDSLLRSDPSLQVLFVEPPADPIHALTQRRAPRPGVGERIVAGYEGRLRTLQPTKWLPRQLGGGADAMLRHRLRRAIRRLGWSSPRLWINDPGWAALAISSGWPSLYDITDDWVEASRGPREHHRLVAADDDLLGRCDEVVVCSDGLLESKGTRRPVTLIKNAVDVARYREQGERPADLPPGPVALYVGTLHEDRLDLELLLETAHRMSGLPGHLVLLGPDALSADNRTRLRSAAAITELGARPKLAVPAYLQHADVLMVPHVVDSFTASLDPLKLYEYLAAGRPVVSTPVAGFREHARTPGFTIAVGESFVDAVVAACEQWSPPRTQVEIPDWPDRAAAMRVVINRLGARG